MPVRCRVCGTSNQTASLFEHFIKEEIYPIPMQNATAKSGEKSKFKRRLKANAVPSIEFDEGLCDIRDVKLTKKYFCLQCKTIDNVIHFKFPTNLEKRNEWLKRCGYGPDFFNGKKFWYLCVRHFSNETVLRKERTVGATRLQVDAVPTIFMTKQKWSSNSDKNTSTNEPEIGKLEKLSTLIEDTNKHIARFIVLKLTKKTRHFCKHCEKEVSSTSPVFSSKLTARKKRGYWRNPSQDVTKITMKCEIIFCQYKHLIHLPYLKNMLVTKLFLSVAETVFNSTKMLKHISEHELFCDHKTKLIKLVVRIYFELQFHHESRCLNKKAN